MEKPKKIRGILKAKKLDAFLITNLSNIRYLSGFSGSNALCLITSDMQSLLTDSRYDLQIKEETKYFKIFISIGSLFEGLLKNKLLKGIKKVGFEADHISYSTLLKLKKLFPDKKFVPLSNMIENLAAIKTAEEIIDIKIAVDIAGDTWNLMQYTIKPGETERFYSGMLSFLMRYKGSEGDAFDPILACGSNTAKPHHKSSEQIIRKNEPILMDFGSVFKGYCSDITRNILIGKPPSEYKKVFQVVSDAKNFSIDKIKTGVCCKDIDAIARKYIEKKGYGKFFNHALGHGLGLKGHQLPLVSYRSDEVLEENMVITIEPGIYIPGKFGIRIEDDVVVRKDGCEILNVDDGQLVVI